MKTFEDCAKHFLGEFRMPKVPLPEELNYFAADGVEIDLRIGWQLPGGDSIKAVSVLGMLWDAYSRGVLAKTKEVIEATSGNTGLALITLSREEPFCVPHVKLVVQNDLAVGKRGPLVLLSQVPDLIGPEGKLSGIATARKYGGGGWRADDSWQPDNGVLCLDQYGNLWNKEAHARITGPEIFRQNPDITVVCGGVGTGGAIGGVGQYFSPIKNVAAVAVKCAPGQKIPGVRDDERMKEITIPWRDHIDAEVEIGTRAAYLMTQWLIWLTPWSFGPSSGFAVMGALQFINDCKNAGTLDELRVRNPKSPKNGKVSVAVICPDTYRAYIDHFHADLSSDDLRRTTSPLPWTLLKAA